MPIIDQLNKHLPNNCGKLFMFVLLHKKKINRARVMGRSHYGKIEMATDGWWMENFHSLCANGNV